MMVIILSFGGTNDEIVLTHVHDTGLLLTDSGGSPTLQFHDSNESVSSDGSKLILTSNGGTFSFQRIRWFKWKCIKNKWKWNIIFWNSFINR